MQADAVTRYAIANEHLRGIGVAISRPDWAINATGQIIAIDGGTALGRLPLRRPE